MILIRRNSYEYPSEILLLKKNAWSNNVTVANQFSRTVCSANTKEFILDAT
jgi:hypothetical protein